jgi:hypothetical protein
MIKKVSFILLAGAILLMLCAVAQAYKLPDTGQTKCYDSAGAEIPDCSGTGQDGEYSINPLSYTDNGDYTVTDNNTGLMWQKCSVGQTNNSTCTGAPSVYYWYQASGLHNDMYNPSSQNVCGSAQTGYYTDWRLPSKKELMSLVNYSYEDSPVIQRDVFPNTGSVATDYWATDSKGYLSAWAVAFSHGNVDADYYPTQNYVRCVRGGQYPSQNYTDNSNGTVTDNGTELVWQKCSAGLNNDADCSGNASTYNWEQAFSYCKGLQLGDKEDWRLPNIKELESLSDDTNFNPSINALFPRTYPHEYWSSTTIAIWPDEAFMVNFYLGKVVNYDKTIAYYVRCVRDDAQAGSYNITANSAGTGTGSMTSSPEGISYGYPAKASQAASFSSGATVMLTGKAGTGSAVSWNGTCAGGAEAGNGTSTATCTFSSLSDAKTVTATFTQLYAKITAKAKGTASGRVVSAPSGISFTYPAKKADSGTFKKTSTVKISAKSKAGATASWKGTCKKAGGKETGNNKRNAVCSITVTKAATVIATFRK